MKWIDITKTLRDDMIIWPGSPGFKHKWIAKGNHHEANLSKVDIELHTGTHLDAPSHFLNTNDYIDGLELEHLIGRAQLLEFKGKNSLTADDLDKHYDGSSKKLILKCNEHLYSSTQFEESFCALDRSAAEWVVEQNIHFIGIDYLSIQKFIEDYSVHIILLESNIIIAENLDLSMVTAGSFDMICLPLKIKAEAAPARVLLSPL